MYLSYIAGLLGFTSGLVQAGAIPSPVSTRSTGFVSQCSDIIYNSGWLVANCPNEAGKSISSGVYLPLHVTNDQGKLQWQKDGAYQYTCSQCELLNGGATLQCYCAGTYTYQYGNSTLDLEQYIANYDGHLLSSLEGPPTVHSDSSLAVPPNVDLSLNAFSNPPGACPAGYSDTLEFAGPKTCWSLSIGPEPVVWTSLMATINEGWSVSVYNVSTCTGAPLVTFDQNSQNDCIAIGGNGGAYFMLTPLWNWH